MSRNVGVKERVSKILVIFSFKKKVDILINGMYTIRFILLVLSTKIFLLAHL